MTSLSKLVLCTAMALAIAAPGSTEAADAIGKVAAIKGFPTASGPGGARELERGSQLFEGDTIKASNGGNVQVVLNDGTRLVVGPASQLVLETYLLRNEKTASKVAVKALRGYFRFITGNSPKSAYSIKTANATVGIRGTGFDLRVRNLTLAAVLIGGISLRGENQKAVNVPAGCGVAEAGRGSTDAKVFEGRAKANRLQQDFIFVLNQGSLLPPFQLPVKDCKVALGSDFGPDGSDNLDQPVQRTQRPPPPPPQPID
jgi:hypothetical protein